MKFKSIDKEQNQECATEIRNVDTSTIRLFVQTWVADFLVRHMRDPEFSYSMFFWDKIIRSSFITGSDWRCYGAFTEHRLDGLLCLSSNVKLKIVYIATAPWNYYKVGKMSRIGSGLIYFTIKTSQYLGKEGEFILNSLPDAEKFYEQIGMVHTGEENDEGLKEYKMPKKDAEAFLNKFNKYIIEE